VNDGQRVLLPRQRIGVEDSTGKRHGSIGHRVLTVDTSHILTT
jgi:hypothetical protein